MVKDPDLLIASVRGTVGIDAYHMYPDSRRAIPEAVLWGFASACVLEFVKGAIDFKALGESVRRRVDTYLAAWRDKESFEAYLAVEGVKDDVRAAIAATPALAAQDVAAATARLEASLVDMGIDTDTAKAHALAIAALVEKSAR